jgi:aminopeptidase N
MRAFEQITFIKDRKNMKTQEPRTIYLKDYKPAPYLIDAVELDVRLHPSETKVSSRLSMRPNPEATGTPGPLVLDGE